MAISKVKECCSENAVVKEIAEFHLLPRLVKNVVGYGSRGYQGLGVIHLWWTLRIVWSLRTLRDRVASFVDIARFQRRKRKGTLRVHLKEEIECE